MGSTSKPYYPDPLSARLPFEFSLIVTAPHIHFALIFIFCCFCFYHKTRLLWIRELTLSSRMKSISAERPLDLVRVVSVDQCVGYGLWLSELAWSIACIRVRCIQPHMYVCVCTLCPCLCHKLFQSVRLLGSNARPLGFCLSLQVFELFQLVCMHIWIHTRYPVPSTRYL